MAKLIPPDGSTKMVRSTNTLWRNKKWHILANNRTEVGECGAVCYCCEWSTLEEVKAKDICAICWPYGKE